MTTGLQLDSSSSRRYNGKEWKTREHTSEVAACTAASETSIDRHLPIHTKEFFAISGNSHHHSASHTVPSDFPGSVTISSKGDESLQASPINAGGCLTNSQNRPSDFDRGQGQKRHQIENVNQRPAVSPLLKSFQDGGMTVLNQDFLRHMNDFDNPTYVGQKDNLQSTAVVGGESMSSLDVCLSSESKSSRFRTSQESLGTVANESPTEYDRRMEDKKHPVRSSSTNTQIGSEHTELVTSAMSQQESSVIHLSSSRQGGQTAEAEIRSPESTSKQSVDEAEARWQAFIFGNDKLPHNDWIVDRPSSGARLVENKLISCLDQALEEKIAAETSTTAEVCSSPSDPNPGVPDSKCTSSQQPSPSDSGISKIADVAGSNITASVKGRNSVVSKDVSNYDPNSNLNSNTNTDEMLDDDANTFSFSSPSLSGLEDAAAATVAAAASATAGSEVGLGGKDRPLPISGEWGDSSLDSHYSTVPKSSHPPSSSPRPPLPWSSSPIRQATTVPVSGTARVPVPVPAPGTRATKVYFCKPASFVGQTAAAAVRGQKVVFIGRRGGISNDGPAGAAAHRGRGGKKKMGMEMTVAVTEVEMEVEGDEIEDG